MPVISNISSGPVYTAPSAPVAAKTPAAQIPPPAAPAPAADSEPHKASAVQVPAAAAGAISYRNTSGDTVNLSGVVLKDRDGDGGVGLPATTPKVPASNLQEKVLKTYSSQ
jgi:hypothetical protein